MGKINLKGVIIGGLVAGVVLNIVDYILFGVLLKNDMAAAMQALNKPPMADSVIPWFVFLDFLYGIFLVWLYAAIRPRFGAGPATAVKAGLAASKFKNAAGFGDKIKGHIMLTDHGDEAWFRNVKIRELPAK